MFRCVVYRNASDNTYSVQEFRENHLDKVYEYQSIEELPNDIKNKVKQLMWVNPDDHTMTGNLGLRVGDNAFWIMENGE